jgi:hypothetical protein
MDKKTRTLVWQRADGICEYCRLWQEHEPFIRFQIELAVFAIARAAATKYNGHHGNNPNS